MLTLLGNKHRLCDKVSRRDALRIGALGVGGLTLADLLRADAQSGQSNSHKAVIMIYMCGAPSHQDMYDLKMDAPAEIRGEFRPDSDERAGHRNLRTHAAHRGDHGQACSASFGRRFAQWCA